LQLKIPTGTQKNFSENCHWLSKRFTSPIPEVANTSLPVKLPLVRMLAIPFLSIYLFRGNANKTTEFTMKEACNVRTKN
jgi:hypothetical protein